MEIQVDTGKHVLIEIMHGGKHLQVEAWRCLKCDEVFEQPWKTPPALTGCLRGDRIFDRSILRRSPARQPDPIIFMAEEAILRDLKMPMFLMMVSDNEGFGPILFHPKHPGFVLIRSPEEYQKTMAVMNLVGFHLIPSQEPATMPIHDEKEFANLPKYAETLEIKAVGIYWNMKRGLKGVEYSFLPFVRSNA